jgi:transcription termination factor Rho
MSREAREGSTLSDLHSIAAELDIDGYRRMRKGELIAAILGEEYTGEEPEPAEPEERQEDEREERPRRSRSRSRRSSRDGGRSEEPEESVEGTVEVLDNGSGFVRLSPPDPSDGDVYISAAQIRRCELVSGDRVTGPVRPPRRSERYPSLVRVETINDRPADEVADGTPYEKLAAAFPSVAFALGADRPELVEVAERAPVGRGSRVTVSGPFASGRTTLLRSLAGALAASEGVEAGRVAGGGHRAGRRCAPGLKPGGPVSGRRPGGRGCPALGRARCPRGAAGRLARRSGRRVCAPCAGRGPERSRGRLADCYCGDP